MIRVPLEGSSLPNDVVDRGRASIRTYSGAIGGDAVRNECGDDRPAQSLCRHGDFPLPSITIPPGSKGLVHRLTKLTKDFVDAVDAHQAEARMLHVDDHVEGDRHDARQSDGMERGAGLAAGQLYPARSAAIIAAVNNMP